MTEARIELPPLPEPDVPAGDHHESDPAWFTAAQMREYAREAVLAERERAVRVCDQVEQRTCGVKEVPRG